MTSVNLQRRVFVISVVAAGAGCASSGALAQSMVNEVDPQAKVLGYVGDATKADSKRFPTYVAGHVCGNCALYQGTAGAAAGDCPLFTGKMVSSKGWCSAWAKKG